MDSVTQNLKTDYDAVFYPSGVHARTHPGLMAAVAARIGFIAQPVENCRVLEIGCAGGGNLLPMCEQMPQSHFVGIDLSGEQIAYGQSIIAELGLANVELRCQDLMDLRADSGEFHYIIAHGFYSWVPACVRKRLLEICQRHLAPNGLVFISFATLPGSYGNLIARELGMFHSRGISDDEKRVESSREILGFMLQNTPGSMSYRETLRRAHTKMTGLRWQFVRHDELGAMCEPLYFWQLMEEAEKFELGYVGDTEYAGAWGSLPEPVRHKIEQISSSSTDREQYLDFVLNQTFRSSLLCRREALPAAGPVDSQIRKTLFAAGNPVESSVVGDRGMQVIQFTSANGMVQLRDQAPLSVIRGISKAWPRSVSYPELVDIAVTQSAKSISRSELDDAIWRVIDLCFVSRVIDLSTASCRNIADAAPEFPRATSLARWQAEHLPVVADLRHKRIEVDDLIRRLVPLCDGSNNWRSLSAAMTQGAPDTSSASDSGYDRERMEDQLNRLVSLCLLLKDR
jgi:SAM-dependent methyltransferase